MRGKYLDGLHGRFSENVYLLHIDDVDSEVKRGSRASSPGSGGDEVEVLRPLAVLSQLILCSFLSSGRMSCLIFVKRFPLCRIHTVVSVGHHDNLSVEYTRGLVGLL